MKLLLLLLIVTYVYGQSCYIRQYTFSLLRNDNYEIHGLWPDVCCNSKEYPEFCRNVTFDLSKLKPIIQQLRSVWFPTTDIEKQNYLMKHEYLKHGSCSHYDLLTYFNVSLCLYNNVNLNKCHEKECLFTFIDNNLCNLTYDC